MTKFRSIALIAILLVAGVFRFYQLDEIPPGLFADEATHALDAREVLAGQITLYSPDEGSTGALWRYLLALHFALFGDSIYSLRAFAAAVGVAGVLVAYLALRELALLPPGAPGDSRRAWLREAIPLVAALLLAVSRWHVELSRVAFSAALMLLVQDFTFFSLWRALNGRKRGDTPQTPRPAAQQKQRALNGEGETSLRSGVGNDKVQPSPRRWHDSPLPLGEGLGVRANNIWFWVFGASLGLLFYNYLPGKLAPALLVLFFLLEWLIRRRQSFAVQFRRPLLLAFGLALLIALPLLIFVAFNAPMLIERATLPGTQNVTLPSPWQGVVANLAAFGLWPSLWLGRWDALFLGPLLSLCFVAGTAAALVQVKRPNYLFALVWWLVMLLPSALAPEGAVPHLRRAIGAATITYGLAALGLAALVTALFWLARRQRIAPALPAGVTLALGLALAASTGLQTYQRYFVEWGRSEEARLEFHLFDLELAELMARESGPETVYLLPLDSTAGIVNPLLDSITFVYRGQAGYDFLPDDEQLVPARLTEAVAGRQQVRLLTWKVTKHTGADPKNLADYYLEKWGERQQRDSYRYFDIDTYRLPPQPVTFAPAELSPLDTAFEGQMALVGAAFGPELGAGQGDAVAAGGRVWAELAWQKLAESPGDYQVSVWLEDESGHPVGQADKQLWRNETHRPSSSWPAGATERDYYLLRVDPTAAPGRYRLKAVLYDGATGRRLAPALPDVGADLAVTLGEMTVLPAPQPPDSAALDIPQRLDVPPVDGLKLLGFASGLGESVRPGDRATLWLWWQVVEPPADLTVAAGLGNEQQAWPLAEPTALGSGAWPVGSVIRTSVEVRVPAAVDSGGYNLGLRLLAASGGEQRHELILQPVQVTARERSFAAPEIARPVGANFGDVITLLGYDIDLSQVEATGVVKLALVWQAQTEMDTPYKVFVHLVDESGQIVAQLDQEPQAGAAPTTGWLPGEVIQDEIEVPTAESLAQVTGINLGLYDPVTGARLPLANGLGETVVRLALSE